MTGEREWGRRGAEVLLLGAILVAGAGLRLYGGLHWDGGQWLQPDERQIYFVTNELHLPRSLAEALSPASPLNPHFFAYGSLPFYLLRAAAWGLAAAWPAVRDPDNLHLAGRLLAVVLDLGTVLLTYRLALKVARMNRGEGGASEAAAKGGALLAAALVSGAVLHVQLARFYTADILLTFLVMLTLNLAADAALGGGRGRLAGLGAALGLAMATKISAAGLALPVAAAVWMRQERTGNEERSGAPGPSREAVLARDLLFALFFAGLAFVAAQPYAVLDARTFLADTLRESGIAWGRLDVPYTRQYAGTWPLAYSVWQTALWGLGLPLGLAAWAALGWVLWRWLREGGRGDGLLLAWVGPYVAVAGLLHARYLRYMLPAVPALCILVGLALCRVAEGAGGRWPAVGRRTRTAAAAALVALSLGYAVALVRLYGEPHTWLAASEWVYREVPGGSTLAVEGWDTALPLPLDVDGQARRIEEYDVRELALYDEPDDRAKWEKLAAELAASDYVIIASRRLYGSIPRLPERYPLTGRYYERLFAGELGFEPAAEFERGPAWLNPRAWPLPGAAPGVLLPDESFVVYDHPRTMVWRNVGRLTAEEIAAEVAGEQ